MLIKFIILIFVSTLTVYCQQIDDAFCDQIIIPSDSTQPQPFPGENIYDVYSAEIEINKPSKKETTQVREFYDGRDNVGIIVEAYDGFVIKQISNFLTNELITINGYDCVVMNLKEAIQQGGAEPFYSIKKNNTDHIVTLLGLFNENQNKMTFTGEKQIRGIPAKQWGTCIYEPTLKKTTAFLVAFSDESKWTPAHITPDKKSVPIEIKIASKDANTGNIEYIENYITRYKQETLLDEDLIYTGPGVYCPNRAISSHKPFPDITKKFPFFSTWIQNTAPASAIDYTQGALRSYRMEHDFPKKLYRLDYYQNDRKITSIHDYNTGLVYTIDVYAETCEITPVTDINDETSEPQLVEQFFQANKEPPFEYTGATRVRGINTDVWIAPRQYQGENTLWEWHFMTDQWVSQEINGVRDNEPVLLNIFFPINQTYKYLDQFHYIQFDTTRIDLFDFDLSSCEANLGAKHIAFELQTDTVDNYHLMKANQEIFKDVLIVNIQDVANISLIRISRLGARFHDKKIFISLTLLEKPAQIGPVSKPSVEKNLNDAYESLKKAIINKILRITLVLGNAQFVTAVSITDSFTDLDQNDGRNNLIPVLV